MMSDAYKKAGVNLNAGYEAVSRIKKHADKTKIPGVLGGIGGFGGMFDMSALNMAEPVLVSGTDGVGTKLMLAFETKKHTTIGIDAVAMCVNDIITVGAVPLFFLDYIACGKVEPDVIEDIVSGVGEGCLQSGCALVGGEIAEHPDMMPEDEYDIAGFCVGAVEKSKIITGEDIKEGDLLIGLASSGVHSNGFSLIRKIISEKKLDLNKTYPDLENPLGEVFLTPTRIYAKPVRALCAAEHIKVKGMAHITGGGFIENIPRILPRGLAAAIDIGSWEVPAVFRFLAHEGGIEDTEMFSLFNMGMGMIIAISAEDSIKALTLLRSAGEKATLIGRVVSGEGVMFEGKRRQ